jgi:hypothetical protein
MRPRAFLAPIASACLLCLAGQADARSIGGYVDRAEDRFVRNVWNFIKEFQTPKTVGSNSWVYTQYYFMEPYVFTTANDTYTDAVDFIYSSGHGNSYYLQTNKSTGAGIYFPTDMPAGNGLGDYNAEYLVIESCSTVQSLQETNDPWSNWMSTLKGLHQIVGFHTISYSDNGIPNNYAKKLKAGGAVWQSWFQAVNEERSWWRGSFYPGMASAIFYDGTRYDTLASSQYPDPYQWGGWHSGVDWGYIWNWYQY